MTDTRSNAESWKDALQPGPDCLSIERLADGQWTPSEQGHVSGCPTCQAELALWESFRDDVPGAETPVVQQIAARLAARRSTSPGRVIGRIGPLMSSPWMKIAAAVVMVAGLGYFVINPEPGIRTPAADTDTYRSGSVQLVAPIDDVASAPVQLTWLPVPDATRYDIVIREVDGTVFWSGSAATSPLSVPADIVARMVPGKTLTWTVSASSAQGGVLAASPAQRFRVTPR